MQVARSLALVGFTRFLLAISFVVNALGFAEELGVLGQVPQWWTGLRTRGARPCRSVGFQLCTPDMRRAHPGPRAAPESEACGWRIRVKSGLINAFNLH